MENKFKLNKKTYNISDIEYLHVFSEGKGYLCDIGLASLNEALTVKFKKISVFFNMLESISNRFYRSDNVIVNLDLIKDLKRDDYDAFFINFKSGNSLNDISADESFLEYAFEKYKQKQSNEEAREL